MKYWNKETRNEDGKFYRNGDWSIEKPEGWDNGKGNFTSVSPPPECLREENQIACDWDEKGQRWIPDQGDIDALRAKEIEAELRQIDLESIRPLRAARAGAAAKADTDKISKLEDRAQALRGERARLI
jgi:hypothetical protein